MRTNTAERVLDLAQALMVERGYNAFSYADIAEVVKVSKATIHFHFATKALLAERVVRRYRDYSMAKRREVTDEVPDAPTRLEVYAYHWEDCIRTKTKPLCMCVLLAAEMLTLPDQVKIEVQAYFRELEAWLASTLRDGVRQGTLRVSRSPALEAKAFLALVYGAMLSGRLFGDAAAFAAVVGEAIRRLKVPVRGVKKTSVPVALLRRGM